MLAIEKSDGNYSAYVPDLPGCVATGETVAIVETEVRDAVRFHIDGLEEDGLPVPCEWAWRGVFASAGAASPPNLK